MRGNCIVHALVHSDIPHCERQQRNALYAESDADQPRAAQLPRLSTSKGPIVEAAALAKAATATVKAKSRDDDDIQRVDWTTHRMPGGFAQAEGRRSQRRCRRNAHEMQRGAPHTRNIDLPIRQMQATYQRVKAHLRSRRKIDGDAPRGANFWIAQQATGDLRLGGAALGRSQTNTPSTQCGAKRRSLRLVVGWRVAAGHWDPPRK